MKISVPQIKICGLTKPDQAEKCAILGADAIGMVFYEKSPRNISTEKAREISLALPEQVARVGVFVDESFEFIMRKAEKSMLTAVQLHGNEPPQLAEALKKEGIIVIKALFASKEPDMDKAGLYGADAFLVECGKGVLPGGNARAWDWKSAKKLALKYPVIIAGGLSPENVAKAASRSLADGVDVSSSVESSPGDKNLNLVEKFIKNIKNMEIQKNYRRIF